MPKLPAGVGLVPEQAWEDPDLPASPFGSDAATASIGFTDGKAAGSASPLTWARAQELRLILSLVTGANVDTRPSVAVQVADLSDGGSGCLGDSACVKRWPAW